MVLCPLCGFKEYVEKFTQEEKYVTCNRCGAVFNIFGGPALGNSFESKKKEGG